MIDRTIPKDIRQEIHHGLDEIQEDNNVKILYACESGSRAWGFASEDSDYDVRFIYCHHPNWYLSVQENRDVIEVPIDDELDISGWDLRKALRLYRKSNPPLLEWLQSPIRYIEHYSTARQMRDLAPSFYSPKACMYHYLHMAQGNFRTYLQTDIVWTKKYFYVLRPLLGCLWIEKDIGVVPTEFEKLIEGVDLPHEVCCMIDELLEMKITGQEMSSGPRNPILNDFIESEFLRHENNGITRQAPENDVRLLDNIFQTTLKEVWGYSH